MLYFWSKSCNKTIKQYVVKIYHGLIFVSIISGFRNFIYQHIIIDIILLILFSILIYQKHKIIIFAYKAIFMNLTPIMKKYLFFYIFVSIVNLTIYTIM